jgi:class 3 adenylate cyclase
MARLAQEANLPGLGVGVGIHTCPVAVGLFGPNEEFTAFGTGMNATARLQSEASFREILVMENTVRILENESLAGDFRFEGPHEASVKNVQDPLKFFKLQLD